MTERALGWRWRSIRTLVRPVDIIDAGRSASAPYTVWLLAAEGHHSTARWGSSFATCRFSFAKEPRPSHSCMRRASALSPISWMASASISRCSVECPISSHGFARFVRTLPIPNQPASHHVSWRSANAQVRAKTAMRSKHKHQESMHLAAITGGNHSTIPLSQWPICVENTIASSYASSNGWAAR